MNALRSETGAALVMSLFMLLLITTMGMALLTLGMIELQISENWKQATVVFYAAEAGVEWAKVRAASESNWPSLVGQYTDPESVSGATYTVTISQPNPLNPLTVFVSSAAQARGAQRTVFATFTMYCGNESGGSEMPTERPCLTPAGQVSQSIYRAVRTHAWGQN